MSPEEERLFQIFHPYAAVRQAAVFTNGTRFVYYTKAETAVRILTKKEIWMRKSMCMNDVSEVIHGLRCLEEAYLRRDAGKRFRSVDG